VPRSVLVVDDDDAFRGLVTRILRGWGHVVIAEVGSVAEALTQVEALRPDTVLVDIGLPDGDGFDLTRQLSAKPWPMRVVLFSSDADCANAAGADRAGAVGFLPKDEMSGLAMRRLVENDAGGSGADDGP
jgi:CheY-like chemotaxis protein